MQFLNTFTLSLAVVSAFAACTSIYFGVKAKTSWKTVCLLIGLLFSISTIYWAAMTGVAWKRRSDAHDFLMTAIEDMNNGRVTKMSEYVTEEQRERITTLGPRINYPPRSIEVFDYYLGTYDFEVVSADGDTYWIRVNAFPPEVPTLFRKPKYSLQDIEMW